MQTQCCLTKPDEEWEDDEGDSVAAPEGAAQLVVELLSWPDDDAELRDSVRHVLPGLLERSHWLIGQNHLCTLDHSPGNGGALLLPAR